jgi:hypothetical protein
MKKSLKTVMLSLVTAVMVLVAVGCQTIDGVDLNKALLNNATVQSMQGSFSVSLDITIDPDNPPTDEKEVKLLEALNQAKLTLSDMKMESKKKISFKGSLALAEGEIPFQVYMTDEKLIVQLEGAKKPFAFDLTQTGAADPELQSPISKETLENLQKSFQDPKFIEKFADFFYGHLPNPSSIKVSRVSESVHGETLNLFEVESVVKGDELLPLLKQYIKNIAEDDQGLKDVLGVLYDILKPVILEAKSQMSEEDLNSNPYLQTVFQFVEEDREVSINMLHSMVKIGLMGALMGLENVEAENAEAAHEVLNENNYAKVNMFVDSSMNIRKSETEVMITPPEETNDGVQSIKINVVSEAWGLNQAVKADALSDEGAIVPGPDFTPYDFLNNLDEKSELYGFLKNDLKITNRNVILFVEEAPLEGFNQPFVREGVTYVPARFVSEELYAKVGWDGEKRQVTIKSADGSAEIKLTIDSKQAEVNGKPVTLEGNAMLVGGTTYVPVRFLVESFGGTIEWDQELQMIEINVE